MSIIALLLQKFKTILKNSEKLKIKFHKDAIFIYYFFYQDHYSINIYDSYFSYKNCMKNEKTKRKICHKIKTFVNIKCCKDTEVCRLSNTTPNIPSSFGRQQN